MEILDDTYALFDKCFSELQRQKGMMQGTEMKKKPRILSLLSKLENLEQNSAIQASLLDSTAPLDTRI